MQGKEKMSDEKNVREGIAVVGDERDMREMYGAAREGRDDIQEEDGAAGDKQEKGIHMQEEDKEEGKDKAQAGLERELMAQLEWYAMHVADPEYDAKAVESILYLLDSVAPLEEGTIPPKEEAWERFLALADSREELLPLENGVNGLRPVDADAGELAGAGAGKGGKLLKFRSFVVRHKMIAAAVVVLVIFAVSGTIQAGARRGEGFFFWLKEDETGMTMITSPQNLDDKTNMKEDGVFEKNDVPEWAQAWSEIETGVVMLKGYEWECYETNELSYFQSILSRYCNKDAGKDIVLGMVIYFDKISLNKREYADYDYVQDYQIEKKQLKIYSKTEESGKVYYTICFYEDNFEYYVKGEDNLDEIKELMTRYLEGIENKKNENIM